MNHETKTELARGFREAGLPFREIALLLDASVAAVRRWISDAKQSPYLQPNDVARILCVSSAKVRKWCSAGELRATNLNSGSRPHFVIRREDLDHFIKSRQPEPKVLRLNRRPFDTGSFKRYYA
jgi:hypothetical protein